MREAVPLLPLYAFMAQTGKVLIWGVVLQFVY